MSPSFQNTKVHLRLFVLISTVFLCWVGGGDEHEMKAGGLKAEPDLGAGRAFHAQPLRADSARGHRCRF